MIQTFLENIFQDRELIGDSINWANWMSKLTLTTCLLCAKNHGKIFPISILKGEYERDVAAHERCKCKYVPMRTKAAGTATDWGVYGADMHLVLYGKLPNNYISKAEARKEGWASYKGNLSDVAPGKTIGGDVYRNKDGKLPQSAGRVWYEADINYTSGYRGIERILYSSDGLIFVTCDHYQTFYEITR